MSTVGNVGITAYNVRYVGVGIGMKSIAKETVKNTGKLAAKEMHDQRKSPGSIGKSTDNKETNPSHEASAHEKDRIKKGGSKPSRKS